MKRLNLICTVLCLAVFSGCAQVNTAAKAAWGVSTETVKTIWGSSTRALEKARADAIEKTYSCSLNDCYDAVLALDRKVKTYVDESFDELGQPIEETDESGEKKDESVEEKKKIEPESGGVFDVFINDRKKSHIVVMGVRGNVDTTEVGIFFSQPSLTTVKIEVASLSGNAKRNVAQMVFDELDLRFSAVK